MHRLVLLASVLLAACDGGRSHERGAPPVLGPSPAKPTPPPAPPPPAPVIDASQGSAMATTDLRDKLPTPFDLRITRALEAPVPETTAIAFDHVAMAKLPYTNYRYQLTADGKLFYVQHSATPGDWQVPFDRPLPAKPSMQLDTAAVTALLARLEAAGFFDHPGYQADPNVEDGSYWIVRARRGKTLHTVVFQNTQPDHVAALAALADPLWKNP